VGWVGAAAAASVLALAPLPTAAVAAETEAVTWSVAPADAAGPDGRSWVETDAAAGDVVIEHLALRNLGTETATFQLTAADGYFTETGRFSMLQAGETSTGSGTWITVRPEVTVDAGATAVVPFEVEVPENATPGDHAAGIAASVTRPGTTAEGTRVGVESRVGFRVMTRVEGDIAAAVAVDDLRADYSGTWNPFAPGSISVQYTAANTGNVQLSITDSVGGTDAERGELLPGEARRVAAAPYDQWPLGPVTVEVVVRPDAGVAAAEPVRSSIVVWAVPWPQLLLALGSVLLLASALAGRRRGRDRLDRMLEQARAEGRREAQA
jgi:hypothetical protein